MPKTPIRFRPLGRPALERAEDREGRDCAERLQDHRDALAVIIIVASSILICGIVGFVAAYVFSGP